ncbi:hypothetical protein BJP34_06745 [Moorena producens PAL-8-15-08-1]|uniref:Uncharacterized protein n=1 Tax=Moorena producens PAL-8-15-08-1 TaxID=1458985 RepID=A0A1D8TNH5_9CYAN|nr:hypothetical protein BJP34_06745 [Moorena producens PAL-8-15-08-1]
MDMAGSSTPAPDNGSSVALFLRRRTKASVRVAWPKGHKKVKNIVNKSNYGAKIKAEKLAPILIGALDHGELNSPRVAPEHGKLITAPAKSTLQYTPSGSLETVPSTSSIRIKSRSHSAKELVTRSFTTVFWK